MQRMRYIGILLLDFVLCQASCGFAENVRETPIVKAIQKAAPAVVNIATEQTLQLRQHPVWGALPVVGEANLQSLGSGVLVSSDGLIVTNGHVVNMASKVFVTLQNGRTSQAVLIGNDNANDLALIKIEGKEPLPFMTMAEDVLIGEPAISIGNPMGLQNSVTAGIVSGTGRTFYTTPQVEAFTNLVQTDASINQGSSGGALINLDGKLIGINLAMVQNAQGLAFAIPNEKVRRILDAYEEVRTDKKK